MLYPLLALSFFMGISRFLARKWLFTMRHWAWNRPTSGGIVRGIKGRAPNKPLTRFKNVLGGPRRRVGFGKNKIEKSRRRRRRLFRAPFKKEAPFSNCRQSIKGTSDRYSHPKIQLDRSTFLILEVSAQEKMIQTKNKKKYLLVQPK